MSLVVKKNAEVLFVNWLKEIVELMVSAGAEVNCRDKDLMTPLHAAAASTGTGNKSCGSGSVGYNIYFAWIVFDWELFFHV
jgi:hypothetical protein